MDIDNISCLRSIILMWITRTPTEKDWKILIKLIKTLSLGIKKPKLLKAAKTKDNLALYKIATILGIDDEEKTLIFEDLFLDEELWSKERREENARLHEEEKY